MMQHAVWLARAAVGASLCASAFASPLHAQGAAGNNHVAGDTTVRAAVLPNGLRYFIRHNARPGGRVEIRLVVRAGSLHEDADQRGLAHFVEHMAFRGTRSFPDGQILSYFESIGMRAGIDVNASTSYDRTVYSITIPTGSPGALDTALLIVRDWASAIDFDSSAVAAERAVIRAEVRSSWGASQRIKARRDSALLARSRVLDREPFGTANAIDSATPMHLRRFVRDWYRPERMAIVVVGDVVPAVIDSMLRGQFATLQPKGPPRAEPDLTIPRQDRVVSVATDPECTATNITLVRRDRNNLQPGASHRRSMWIEALYYRIIRRRLENAAQSDETPFSSATAGATEDIGPWRLGTVISVTARDGQGEAALASALSEVERIAQHGVPDVELERARAELLEGIRRDLAGRAAGLSSAHADRYVASFLDGTPVRAHEILAEARSIVPGIRPDDLRKLARRWRSHENSALLVTLPQYAVHRATRSELTGVLASVQHSALPGHAARAASRDLPPRPPVSGRVVRTQRIPSLGMTLWDLSNGIRVWVKPTNHDPDRVLLAATRPAGSSTMPDADVANAYLAARLPGIVGLGDLSRTDLHRALAEKQVELETQLEPHVTAMRGSAASSDIEALLQLVHQHVTALRSDSVAVRRWQEREAAARAAQGMLAETQFHDTLQSLLAGDSRGRAPTASQVAAIDVARAESIYRTHFGNVDGFSFVLVGAIDTASLRPLVERYVASLPAYHVDRSETTATASAPVLSEEANLPLGIEARSRAAIVLQDALPARTPHPFGLSAVAEMLQRRLRARLRDAMGVAYVIKVSHAVHLRPDTGYMIRVEFETAPGVIDTAASAVFDELARLRDAGVTEREAAGVRAAMQLSAVAAEGSDEFWLTPSIR